jgi:hypothetical protein
VAAGGDEFPQPRGRFGYGVGRSDAHRAETLGAGVGDETRLQPGVSGQKSRSV